jgi:hypothetical protein
MLALKFEVVSEEPSHPAKNSVLFSRTPRKWSA